ncbi:DNA alkylation repair protein [Candidatus Saccharibacteria bacterium]|nr:DNA alkylation repair protein [Candidatus Saccharibacteria bacterium]
MKIDNYEDFQTALASLSDDEYREFTMRGVPCDRPFLGVRIPEIKRLIQKIPKEKIADFIKHEPIAIEEVLARGFLISRLPYDEMLKFFDSHIKLLDNWCTVDTFCASLKKTIKNHEADFLDRKVEKLLESKNEFAVRVGLVSLLDFYIKPDYIFLIFDRIESLKNRDEYYIKMAVAWLVAECFIKFPDETFGFLKTTELPKWTFNKAISKICDSFRVEKEVKDYLKTLRK